jgi:hypothetical protein
MYSHDGCSRGGRLKRGLLIALFSIGTVGGFASGIHTMKRHCHGRRERFENHVADVCVRAAKAAESDAASKAPPPPPPRADKAEADSAK